MGTVPVDRRTHGSRLRFSSTRRRQKQKKTEKEKNAGSQDERHPRLSRDLSRPRQDHRDGEGGEVDKGGGGEEAVRLRQGEEAAGRGVQDVLQAGRHYEAGVWGGGAEDVLDAETPQRASHQPKQEIVLRSQVFQMSASNLFYIGQINL